MKERLDRLFLAFSGLRSLRGVLAPVSLYRVPRLSLAQVFRSSCGEAVS